MSNATKVRVTGAGGFVGDHLVSLLKRKGYRVRGVDLEHPEFGESDADEFENRIQVAIVAPVHNRREITLRCLRSIARLDTGSVDLHTIIVDDGSTDGTAEAIAARFPDVQVVRGDGNLLYTEATNVGVRAALERNVDYVLMINDDQIFSRDSLRSLMETAERHPQSVVGALLLLWDTPHKVFQVAPQWSIAAGGWRHWYQQTVWTVPDKPWQVEVIVGNCVLVPTRAFREEGLMNSRRYPSYGDVEFTPRLRKRGWNLLIQPRARVFCQPNTPPPRVRDMPLARKVDALFLNLADAHNLRRRFYAYWDGAPSKLQGTAAFLVFLLRAVLRRNGAAGGPHGDDERPLSETCADAVVPD